MEKTFKNDIVKEQYSKFIHDAASSMHSAYKAWLSSLEVFDDYVDEVRRVLKEHAPTKSSY